MPNRLRSLFLILFLAALGSLSVPAQTTDSATSPVAPSFYSAYSGTDAKPIPTAPVLGPANSVFNDPTFGSRILRVTDPNTLGGASLIPTDAGFHRTWNANSTAIKLTNAHGQSYWLEFNPGAFTVGDGSSRPVPHPLSINYLWEWSAVDPDVIYFLNGNQLARYNKATGITTNLGGPSNGDPVAYYAVVVGLDTWVCSAAGAGSQDTFTKIFCIDPSNTSNRKFIDVPNKTINGVVQSDPNWPTSASGQTLGIHSISGGTGASWLEVTFHQQSWGANGDAVLNLSTNTWSLLAGSDAHWSGHTSVGNGRFVNGGGSVDGRDSRGAVLRDANALLDTSKMTFIMQPPTTVNWYDGEHSSWFNSTNNPSAPVLFSRYTTSVPSPWLTWLGEIIMAATDGSNTVWRFAHNHNGAWTAGYYTQAFAQVSNDGNWALFSSWWDGTLGASSGQDFGVATRIDTFIVELAHPATPDTTPPSVTMTAPAAGSITSGTMVTVSASASDNVGVAGVQFLLDGAPLGSEDTAAPWSISWDTTLVALGTHALAATARDAAGNRTTSSPISVTLSLSTPSGPIISSVTAASISSSGAGIGWTTDILSDSQVDYGTSTSYGASTALDNRLLTAHSQSLGGLAAGTLYHYRVKSKDSLGNLSVSGDATFTTATAPPPPSGPVGYWKLDDGSGTTALDASGNGYGGTLLNGPAWVPGVLSGALSFDGVNDSVDVPHAPAFDAYPLTIAAWFKTSATGMGGIINKYYPNSYNGYQIFTTGGNLCAWYFRDTSNYVWDGTGCSLATSGFNDNRWHHVAFVVDATGGRLYVDGVQKAARAWTGTPGPTTTTQDLRFGQYPWTGPLFFPGALDDVRLYSRVLASDEIAALIAAASSPAQGTGPVGYWKLDDGSGTTTLDASGNGYGGTLLNGPAWVPGVLSGALSFDGVNDSVDVPHAPAFDAYPLTIAAWFKTSATGLAGIINKYYPNSVNGYQIFTTGGNLCAWYFRDGSNYIWDGSGCSLATSGFNDNRWHHVAFVVDASGGRLYVDGVQKAARAWTGTPGPTTTTQDLRFGQYPWTGPLFFPGALDDVRLYNRALATSEIASLYGGGNPAVQNVAWTSLVNATATGNSLRKTSGCDGCQDAGAVSQQQIPSGDGYFEFTATETDALRFAGLSNGNPGTSAAEIEYAIRLQTGFVDVRESGVYRAGSTFVSGDVFRVAVESGVVKFYKNGALLYSSAIAPTYPLLVDTCLFNLNATVSNAVIKGAQ